MCASKKHSKINHSSSERLQLITSIVNSNEKRETEATESSDKHRDRVSVETFHFFLFIMQILNHSLFVIGWKISENIATAGGKSLNSRTAASLFAAATTVEA